MEERIITLCQNFIENVNILKKTFRMEYSLMIDISANTLTAQGITADRDRLKECAGIIRKQAGAFSNLNGTVFTPFAVSLFTKEDPQAAFDKVERYYAVIKKTFGRTDYAALMALLLSESVPEEDIGRIVSRGKEIFGLMKKKHPFITDSKDSVLAGFLALSEKENTTLTDEMEASYTLLKKSFSGYNSVQSVSHILSVADGTASEKVAHLTELYNMLGDAGRKYSVDYLPTLAALSILEQDNAKLLGTILEIDGFLSKQKGYGVFGIDRKTRLMQAVMLTSDLYEPSHTVQAATATSSLAIIAALQMMVCICIVASSVVYTTD